MTKRMPKYAVARDETVDALRAAWTKPYVDLLSDLLEVWDPQWNPGKDLRRRAVELLQGRKNDGE